MSESFNFFAAADPDYIFAYMDALALGEMPATGTNSRDPFFVVYNYLREELAGTKTALEELARKTAQQEQLFQECEDFRMAKLAMRKKQKEKNPHLLEYLAELNGKFAWVVQKFHASLTFPFFSDDPDKIMPFLDAFRFKQENKKPMPKTAFNADDLKRILWLQYLATLNVDEMSEIFEQIKTVKRLAANVPPPLSAWFAVAGNIEDYFRDVTLYLDNAGNHLTRLFSTESPPAKTGGTTLREKCIAAGKATASLLHERTRELDAVHALFISAMADPASQIAHDMFTPRGGLAKFIASSRG